MPQSARCANEFHTFWPLTTHSSPSRTAVVVRPARSEPAPGSLNSWHHDVVTAQRGRHVALLLLLGAVHEDRRHRHARYRSRACPCRACTAPTPAARSARAPCVRPAAAVLHRHREAGEPGVVDWALRRLATAPSARARLARLPVVAATRRLYSPTRWRASSALAASQLRASARKAASSGEAPSGAAALVLARASVAVGFAVGIGSCKCQTALGAMPRRPGTISPVTANVSGLALNRDFYDEVVRRSCGPGATGPPCSAGDPTSPGTTPPGPPTTVGAPGSRSSSPRAT